jgi:hypothetical protein
MELKLVRKRVDSLLFLIMLAGVLFITGCINQPNVQTPEKIIFSLHEFLEATEGVYYSYSFCKPDSAISGATCGGLAGATINPFGGNPPYSFSHQFGSGFLPPGLALELNGLLRGTPTLPGNYTFGICASDGQDEACGTTTLIVKPAEDIVIPPENVTPDITLPPRNATPDITANVTADVEISSFSCSLTTVADGYGNRLDHVRAIVQGTAQGPVGARLELPVLIWSDDIWDCGAWTHRTGARIAGGHTCVREEGQPETTTWTVDTGGEEQGGWLNGSSRSYSAKIYLSDDLEPQKEDRKNTICQ